MFNYTFKIYFREARLKKLGCTHLSDLSKNIDDVS